VLARNPVGAGRRLARPVGEQSLVARGVELPEPHRGDLLAVPATGAYTLGMASNYNGVPRPAAVLVADGKAEVIRRRESLEDLLSFEP
jgi:diaminopimelate decarboxylase